MNRTKIEWVKNPDFTGIPKRDARGRFQYQGYTWNPITGCLNHTPDGLCLEGMFPCYAYRLANGRLKSRYLANNNTAYCPSNIALAFNEHPELDPFYPRFWEDRLQEPLAKVVPTKLGSIMYGQSFKGIFACDMGELFGDWIPREWQDKVFNIIESCESHRFYLLTKQPQNLFQFSPFPENVYLGVTVTNQEMFDKAIYYLKMVDAKVKFLSMEPLLERINIDL